MKSEPMTVHNYVKNILYFEFDIFQTFTNYIEIEYISFDHYILCSLQTTVVDYHGNHSDTSITPLFCVVLSPYLVWRFFGMMASAIYLVAIVTRLPWQQQ